MEEIIQFIQMIFICNKESDRSLYENAIKHLSEKNLNPENRADEIISALNRLISKTDESETFNESELRILPSLFEVLNLEMNDSYEYVQLKKILFNSIKELGEQKMSDCVFKKLMSNIKDYYYSKEFQCVSIASLNILLFYIKKKIVFSSKRG